MIEQFIIGGLICVLGYVLTRLWTRRDELKHLRALVYSYHDFAPTCNEDNTCFICGGQWFPNECAPDCLAILMWRAVSEESEASMLWLELTDELEECREVLRPK